MSTTDQLKMIRSRKLGVLIYDARTASRRSVEECAQAVGVSPDQFESYEKGLKSPSLPELEALAFFLDIPLEHFWGNTSLIEKSSGGQRQTGRLVRLRHRIVGTYLRLGRTRANLTQKELANRTGTPEETIKLYENGETPIPLAELEILASTLEMRIEEFFDTGGPIGKWRSDHLAIQQFLQLPPELQEFVCKPVNRPYIDLAVRLSDLSVEKLRAIAESLLEITY